MSRLPVAVLGATGAVGQRFVSLLAAHPWFELAELAASPRSAGRPYGEAAAWHLPEPLPPGAAGIEVLDASSAQLRSKLVFSGLDSSVAGEIEARLAKAGHLVVSNSKNHRMDPDVPLLVPEVNPEHLEMIRSRVETGQGAILTNPNCSTIGMVLALAPLRRFEIEAVSVTTMQALSGAGLPGVPSLDAIDNVVPHIGGEEDKLRIEPPKIFGRFDGTTLIPDPVVVSAQCNRVAVIDGHLESIAVRLAEQTSESELIAAWQDFRSLPQELDLPSAPQRPTIYLEAPNRPQPRLDRDRGAGMSVSVGRLQPCPVIAGEALDLRPRRGWRFVALSHNTLRGAAGGALLVAELAAARGLIAGFSP